MPSGRGREGGSLSAAGSWGTARGGTEEAARAPPRPARGSPPHSQLGDARVLIDFRGFAGGFIVSARMDLTAGRLTDQLNRDASLELSDVTLESLVDGRTGTIDQLVLEPRQLFAAKGPGPRGEA